MKNNFDVLGKIYTAKVPLTGFRYDQQYKLYTPIVKFNVGDYLGELKDKTKKGGTDSFYFKFFVSGNDIVTGSDVTNPSKARAITNDTFYVLAEPDEISYDYARVDPVTKTAVKTGRAIEGAFNMSKWIAGILLVAFVAYIFEEHFLKKHFSSKS